MIASTKKSKTDEQMKLQMNKRCMGNTSIIMKKL